MPHHMEDLERQIPYSLEKTWSQIPGVCPGGMLKFRIDWYIRHDIEVNPPTPGFGYPRTFHYYKKYISLPLRTAEILSVVGGGGERGSFLEWPLTSLKWCIWIVALKHRKSWFNSNYYVILCNKLLPQTEIVIAWYIKILQASLLNSTAKTREF
jgi:restriction endonuclease S subunit